jgi:predicted ester cyclase
MSDQNKRLVRRFYEEVENQGKLELVDELFAADFRDVYNTASPFPVQGTDGVKKLAAALHEHLDLSIVIEDLVAEGDKVVARIACGITHKNPFFGAAPTGRKFVAQGVEMFRVVNGKLAERWVFIDMMPMMKELGVVPAH